jgi:hypothetical protein
MHGYSLHTSQSDGAGAGSESACCGGGCGDGHTQGSASQIAQAIVFSQIQGSVSQISHITTSSELDCSLPVVALIIKGTPTAIISNGINTAKNFLSVMLLSILLSLLCFDLLRFIIVVSMIHYSALYSKLWEPWTKVVKICLSANFPPYFVKFS